MLPSRGILVTGFEPFGGHNLNSSQEVALALDGRVVAGYPVAGKTLPCDFRSSLGRLRRYLRAMQPRLVVCLGQADSRTRIGVERVAINVRDARLADNLGAQPVDEPVVPGGPVAYWSGLPIKAIVAALEEGRIPAEVSQSAGTFVCNHVFYGLMHTLQRPRSGGSFPGTIAGMIHVPLMAEQTPERSGWPLQMLVAGITLALEVAATTRRDRREVGGSLH